MNIVIVPAYRRPALLAATLSCIELTAQACYQRYLFSVDREAYKSIDSVIATFQCPNSGIVRRRHKHPGYTFNILEALKSACEQLKPTDLVYVIAEDVLVTRDFFDFHEEAHRLDPHAAFVSATRGPKTRSQFPDGFKNSEIDQIVYSNELLRGLYAVSFKAYWLSSLCEHATRDYYRDMIGYCARNFASDGLPVRDAEIDGLMRRQLNETARTGLYPMVPRAFHVGFVGTNHGGQPAIEFLNPLDWKSDASRIVDMTSDQMNAMASPDYRDIERGELIRSRVPLRLV